MFKMFKMFKSFYEFYIMKICTQPSWQLHCLRWAFFTSYVHNEYMYSTLLAIALPTSGIFYFVKNVGAGRGT